MKKLLLTTLALLAVITLSAQTNLTEGKTVVPLGGLKTYNNGTTDYTINNDDLQKITVAGNTDNVYLFPEGGGYASDANIALGIQGFYIDLGESKSIGAIRSTWEGAAAGGNIYVTDSQPAADGTLTGETLIATFTNAQETAKNVAVSVTNSGRYLVFVPTDATNYAWGVKIRTFVALEKESSVLTSLLVSPTTVKVGEPTEMTFTPQDQLGLALTGATYSVTNATLEGTTLTATAAGDVQVTATIGDVSVSTTIKAISISNPTTNPDEPEDLTANVIALYSSKYGKGLNENNPGWGVGGGAPNPLYTSLEEVEIADGHKSVHVKGTGFNNRTQNGVAVSADYTTIHVALYPFSATECKIFGDNAYGNAISKTGLVPGQWNYVSVPNDGITQNYICIELVGESEFYLDHFYFAKPAADDSQAPVLDVAELVNTGIGSATLRLKATDDKSAQVTYVITDNNNKTYTTKGDSGAEVTYTITGLLPGTSYTFSVVAQDDNENKSGAQTINASTTAWTAAPQPTLDATEVYALYSDAYTDIHNFSYQVWWDGQAKQEEVEPVAGDKVWHITDFLFLGTEHDEVDASQFEKLHLDVMPVSEDMTLGVTPVNAAEDANLYVNTPTLTANQWNAVEISIEDFKAAGLSMTRAFQIKLTGANGQNGTGQEFYLDNIYYVKGEGGEEPVEQATSGEETAIIESTLPEVNGKELKYTWAFTQEGKNVTITFACTNASEIPGIVDGYIQDKTDGFAESAGLTKTWSNCTEGQILKVAHKWEFAGGAFVTPDFTYTVKAEGDIPQESIVKTVQLLGTWNWDVSVDNLTLTKQADANVWTGTLDLTDIYGDQEFKLVVNGGGDENDNWAGWIGTNKVTVEAPAEWGVFSGTEDNMNMTLNHGKTGYKTYTITATWTEGDNYYEGWTLKIEGKDKADLFVKFVNGKQWNEVYAYTWGVIDVSWPGYKLEKTGTETINGTEYDVYTWNLPAEITGMPQYVIFSDGTGGETQTQNLEFVNGKTYYDMVPVPATIYSIVGELTGGWDADADMTQDADNENIYTLVVEDFEATAEGYQYKLRKNHQWGEGEIPAAGNYTWNPEEVGATYDLTFTFNLSEGTLTLDAVKQSASIVLDTEALDAEIAAAEDLIKDVDQTEGPAKTLADAIAAAKEAKSAATTQDDITTALQTLQTAVAAYKTTTGINTIKLNPADGIIYDLNGRRVLNPAKGIYIQNGRRVVIK